MLEHFRGNEDFVKHIQDLMYQSEHQWRCLLTPFLTPRQQQIAISLLGKKMNWDFAGGYDNAQMSRLAIAPFETLFDFEIVCLKATYKLNNKAIKHKDVLGAFMNLGVERETFGDIIVDQNDIYIFVNKKLASFFMQEVHQIGRYPIQLKEFEGIIEYQEQLEYRMCSIASLRFDCVVAACANISRSKAVQLIQAKKAKLDHMPLEDCKFLCHNNSTISIRGYGRFHLRILDKTSKKGKQIIEVGTYE